MLKRLNICCCSYEVKKQFNSINGVHVLTVLSAQREKTKFGANLKVTRPCQNTKANLSLLPIINRVIVHGSCFVV